MRRLLARLKFVHAVLIVSLVPLAGLVFLWGVHFSTLVKESGQAANAVELVALVEAASNLAQQGAAERGLSAGFLGSAGKKFGPELAEQRQKLDQAFSHFQSVPVAHLGKRSQALFNQLQQTLDNRSEIRRQVDNLNPQSGAFGYYSRLNDLALNLSSRQALQLSDVPSLKSLLDGILALYWSSEYAGQVRGLLNGAFARQSLDNKAFAMVLKATTSEQDQLDRFMSLASVEAQGVLEKARQQQSWQQVEAIQQTVADGGPSDTLADPSNGQWFALATQRIAAIKQVSGELNSKFVAEAHQIKQRALNGLWVTLAVSLMVLLPLCYLIFSLTRSLKKRVAYVDDTLKAITQQSDLTLRLGDTRADEFGNISRSIDVHLEEVNGIFKGFHSTASSASSTMHNIISSAGRANANAEQQNQSADQLAHAMDEIAQASAEVSASMQQARDAMNQAHSHVGSSQRLTDTVTQGFEQLTVSIAENREEIERLAQHSGEISGILDTITGIAEQTNLLALNAAIEAARAGEQGRGFAVVADEVRSLAYKTRESTESVRDMIERLQQSSASALAAMNRNASQVSETAGSVRASSEAVSQVTVQIERVQDLVRQVAAAAEQQSATLAEVNEATVGINRLSQDTAQQVSSVHQEAEGLSEQLQALEKRLSGFRMA